MLRPPPHRRRSPELRARSDRALATWALAALLEVACAAGSRSPADPNPTTTTTTTRATGAAWSPGLSPALEPLDWWLGEWQGEHGSERWVAAAGALYGVALAADGGFECMIVDDGDGPGPADGILRFIAMPGGADGVEFRARARGPASITFANDAHDSPKTIAYRREGDRLVAEVAGGDAALTFDFRRAPPSSAPELEAADRAFSDDTVARGLDGWLAAFDDEGAIQRRNQRVAGKAAIGAAMGPLLGSGELAWAPIASGRRGDLGFTVGEARYVGARPEDGWRSTYVTIWRRRSAAARWLVLFDVGRVVNE